MRPRRGPASRRGERPARPIAPRSTGRCRPSAGPAACVDRQFPIPRTRPQRAGSARTAWKRRSIGVPRIVERPLVQVTRRTDQLGAADLHQDTIERCSVTLLVPDRAARNALAVAPAVDFEARLVAHANARRQAQHSACELARMSFALVATSRKRATADLFLAA